MDPQSLWQAAVMALGPASDHVIALGRRAAARGHGAWLVGGPVRDLLLELPVSDVDLCFETDVLDFCRGLRDEMGGEIRIYATFRTATWSVAGLHIDLVSTRSERYPSPASLPVVRLAGLDEDLHRRDFALNAMALSIHPQSLGELVDPLGGRQDLRDGVLRSLHPGSFVDDPTRALRAARYTARLGLRPTPGTLEQLQGSLGHLQALSLERLGAELHRVLAEPKAERALELLESWGVLGAVHPELLGVGQAVGRARQRLLSMGSLAARVDAQELGWLAISQHLGASREGLVGLVRERKGLASLWRSPVLQAFEPATWEPGGWGPALDGLAASLLPLLPTEPVDWWLMQGQAQRTVVNATQLMARGVRPGPGLGRALAAAQVACWRGAGEQEQWRVAHSES